MASYNTTEWMDGWMNAFEPWRKGITRIGYHVILLSVYHLPLFYSRTIKPRHVTILDAMNKRHCPFFLLLLLIFSKRCSDDQDTGKTYPPDK